MYSVTVDVLAILIYASLKEGIGILGRSSGCAAEGRSGRGRGGAAAARSTNASCRACSDVFFLINLVVSGCWEYFLYIISF